MSERINLSKLFDFVRRDSEVSKYSYVWPIKPRDGEKVRFWEGSPAHVGRFKNARDIIIPDPLIKPLPVYAPQNGKIISLVQNNTLYGNSEAFLDKLNYVTVDVGKGEFYELCHIGLDSCKRPDGSLMQVGDEVKLGQQICMTGANGWMTDRRHIHFMVAKWLDNKHSDFISLKIRS